MDKILTLFAVSPPGDTQQGADDVAGNSSLATGGVFGDDGIVTNIINWILYIVGIVAVVMIIVGGIRYAASAGNEKAVTGAKNTIIYALIGLAAAILAYVLVNFVLDVLGTN